MKRKHFVKQLMSVGYSRNEAAKKAQEVIASGGDYSSAYITLLFDRFGITEDSAESIMQDVKEAIKRFCEMLPILIEYAVNTIYDSLQGTTETEE